MQAMLACGMLASHADLTATANFTRRLLVRYAVDVKVASYFSIHSLDRKV